MEEIDSVETAISIVRNPEKYLSQIYDKNYREPPSQIQYPFPFGLWFRGHRGRLGRRGLHMRFL
jgi:hypothetical protein